MTRAHPKAAPSNCRSLSVRQRARLGKPLSRRGFGREHTPVPRRPLLDQKLRLQALERVGVRDDRDLALCLLPAPHAFFERRLRVGPPGRWCLAQVEQACARGHSRERDDALKDRNLFGGQGRADIARQIEARPDPTPDDSVLDVEPVVFALCVGRLSTRVGRPRVHSKSYRAFRPRSSSPAAGCRLVPERAILV